jgi:hypothetical protein
MKAAARFQETQRFRQTWLLILMSIPVLIFIWGFIQQIILGQPFGNHPISDLALIGALLCFIFFYYWFIQILRLEFIVDEFGIHYQFKGIHWKQYHLKWEEIESAQAITYKPLREYGGWGIRYGFNGKAYSVSGNKGIQVLTKGGARILFGTLRSEEFFSTLRLYCSN